jgi:hypothetical protein
MNNKEKIKNIEQSSIFILNDSEYKEITRLLTFKKYNRARLFLENIIEENEFEMTLNPDNQGLLLDCKNLNRLQDLIIDLIVNEEENVERKQFESNIK